MPGRLGKLEGAISKQRTIKFPYYSISRNRQSERTLNPYGLLSDNGSWYVVGQDLDRKDIRTFRVSRIRGDIRFATRRERDFRIPADFDIDGYRGRPPWQIGDLVGEARIELAGDTAWWVERAYGSAGQLEDGVFVTEYSTVSQLASWILRQDGRAIPVEPDELRREVAGALRAVRARHEDSAPKLAAEAPPTQSDAVGERPAGPVVPERFAVLQSLLAYLLAACGDGKDAVIPAHEVIERFHIPEDELEEHLQLLNLVNFGGGCYTVYAALEGDEVHVDKELYGDTFRHAPRLTPLEARAIRLALEFVGPMIAADAHTPLDRVRKKLEETFGEFELSADARSRTPGRGGGRPRRDAHRRNPSSSASLKSSTRRRASKRGRSESSSRTRSSGSFPTGASTLGSQPRSRAQLPTRPHAHGDPHIRPVRAATGLPAARLPRRAHGEGPLSERALLAGGPSSAARCHSKTERRSRRCPSAAANG